MNYTGDVAIVSTTGNESILNTTFIEWDNEKEARLSAHIECSNYFTFILNTLFAGILCLLGLFGNTVSFLVMSKDKTTPLASFLLKTLTLTDNVFLSAWFLHFSLADAFSYLKLDENFHVAWLYIRVYTYPLLFMGQSGTIWLTILIAVTRYIAVCRPYHAAKYCALSLVQKAVITILFCSVVYNVPRFFETTFNKLGEQNASRHTLVLTHLGKDTMYQLIYFDILYYVFSFVLPLLLLVYFNTCLILAYRMIHIKRQVMRTRCDVHDHNNITLVMIMIILLFIVCNAPARLVQLIWRYQDHKCLTGRYILNKLSNVLEVLNSSVNFLIYCVCRRKFRRILKQFICNATSPNSMEIETTKCHLNGVSSKSKIIETEL